MNTRNADYLAPRERVINEITKEMHRMGFQELAALRTYAEQLNKAREEYDARVHLVCTFDNTPESHAE